MKILSVDFFQQPAEQVAEQLLGKFLVRRFANGEELRLMINDIELYAGFEDQASHARFGKTKRSTNMFATGGQIYMYLIYGMHWMFNIVVDQKNYPAAILIRGAGNINGPGKLTKHLALNKDFNAKTLIPKSGLWLEDEGGITNKKNIQKTTRIGVHYAGEWAKKEWRFYLKH